MDQLNAEQIAQCALDRDLIDERDMRDIWGELGTGEIDPEKLKQLLLRREFVTNYQLERLLKGERSGFFYGPYKVLYLIGTGTFARVFRAMHKENREVRAVKVLRNRFLNDRDARDQFCREGEMGRTLRHPNIVPIYEVASEAHQCYLVMEFIEGHNLREFLKVRRFEPADATRLTLDICRGLDYAFQRGISHRDLKSSNVLVSSLGQAKLVDFGLAGADPNLSDAELAQIENPRTIDYAALERATRVRKDDNRSDIFFLGCLYYHMLTGKAAMEETRDRIARLSRNRLDSIVPIVQLVSDLPNDVVSVVHKAMQLDPSLRYQTPGEMVTDLQLVSERLAAGDSGVQRDLAQARKRRTIMIVEPNPNVQETLRSHFKEKGYRVLVTNDPQRPASLSADNKPPADCVIFSTAGLGQEALEAFNHFGDMPATKKVPAILLLATKHQEWLSRAQTSDCRTAVTTPIKMKRLMEMIESLLPAEKR